MSDPSYEVCQRLARTHYENFPVASWLLPADARPHIAAVYAFARIADDFADEGDRTSAERIALLDDWRGRLDRAATGARSIDGTDAGHVFDALGQTIVARDLDPALLADLLDAFRQDVIVKRYSTWSELLDYCRRSANPVGRLVLRICGYRDADLDDASDALCTALQLTNFWQDIDRDWMKGRIYVPTDLVPAMAAFEADLDARRVTPALRSALQEATDRTRALFAVGRRVADGVRGRLRWELRATWLGGVRILDRVEASGFDVFRARPQIGVRDAVGIACRTLIWR